MSLHRVIGGRTRRKATQFLVCLPIASKVTFVKMELVLREKQVSRIEGTLVYHVAYYYDSDVSAA